MNAAKNHDIRAMYIMARTRRCSDPDVDHAREALAALDHLVVQDIFLTETAYLADVVLAATACPRRSAPSPTRIRMVPARTEGDRAARRCEGGLLAAE